MNKIVGQVLLMTNAFRQSDPFEHWIMKISTQVSIHHKVTEVMTPTDMRSKLIDIRENLLRKLDECIALTYKEDEK